MRTAFARLYGSARAADVFPANPAAAAAPAAGSVALRLRVHRWSSAKVHRAFAAKVHHWFAAKMHQTWGAGGDDCAT